MLLRNYLISKIHGIRLTDKNVAYIGSLTLSADLLRAAGIRENEVVQVVNVTTGARLTTYVIVTEQPGQCILNGGAARLAEIGDTLLVMAFGHSDRQIEPRVVFMNEKNQIERMVGPEL